VTRLDVPWRSQLDAQSTAAYDCGQAVTLSLLLYYGFVGGHVTVDDLARRMPGRTDANQLVVLAGYYGMTAVYGPRVTAAILRGYIEQGHPCVLLVNYADLGIPRPDLTDGANQGLHWIVVTGYEGDTFYISDPLWKPGARGGQGGRDIPIAWDTLDRAQRGTCVHHYRAIEMPYPDTIFRAPNVSPLGFHVISGPRNGFGDALRAGVAHSRPVGLVVSVDVAGVVEEVRSLSPDTVTVYRTEYPGGTPAGMYAGDADDARALAEAWYAQNATRWAGVDAHYFGLLNEPHPKGEVECAWCNVFVTRACELAEGEGRRLCVYNFATGTPGHAEVDWLMPSFARMAQGKHALGYHSYGGAAPDLPGLMRDNPALTLRHRDYAARFLERGFMLPFVISECAPFGGYDWSREGAAAFVDDAHWFRDEMQRDSYVLGGALFTLGEWMQTNSNYQDVLAELIG
jgi:hypothetical protein